MNRKTPIGLALAAAAIAAAMAAAVPGNALACPGGLGDNCATIGAGEFGAGPMPGLGMVPARSPAPTAPVRVAAGGCGAAAAQAAAQGQVIGAPKVVKRGNQTLCVVTVLVKDPSGRKPPTRKQITIPAD